VYEGLREARCRRAAEATSEAEAALTSVDIARRQVERSVDTRVALETTHVTSARALTADVTARVH